METYRRVRLAVAGTIPVVPAPLTRSLGRLLVLACGCLLAITASGVVAAPRDAATPDPDVAAAEAALARLPLADRAGQLVMTSIPGAALDAVAVRQLRVIRPGGVIVFGENYRSRAQLAKLLRATQVATLDGSATRPRALVSVDQEGGVVKRLADAPPFRSHPQLGVANRPALTTAQAELTARSLRGVGIQLDLAPVADLDLGPRHVMRERSFGSDPARVATHVAAFVDGLQAGGGAASVKHFPGFGGASVNSDDALARITRTRGQLDVADLAPFRGAVAAGADSIMVSHGIYTALDRRHPASTSPAVYRLLRDELGYDGVAITDSLHASGFAAATHAGVIDGCATTIAAGADIALVTGTLAEAARCRARIVTAVRAGTITRARLDEAALRVLTLKARLGLLG